MIDLAVKGRRILTPEGPVEGVMLVKDGRIEEILRGGEVPASKSLVDAGDYAVIPALVDAHVHVNEPGRADWEGYLTATKAAAAGGVGTIVDMPLNCSPVTTSRRALKAKLDALKGKLAVDAAFWGGIVPANARDAKELEALAQDGVVGFKCFLTHSGLDEFPNATREDLEAAMPVLASLGLPLIVHAELDPCEKAGADPRSFASYLASRPESMEVRAIELLVELCRKTRCRTHVVHLSAASALGVVERAKDEGLPFTAETCPHYLTFAAEGIPAGATQFKCAPPIRDEANRELLWKALGRGVLDFVVSDHSPCVPEMKKLESGDFMGAWGGIAGLQFTLPATWTGAKRRGFELEDVVRWTAQKTADFVGMASKGRLEKGRDADFAVFDDAAIFEAAPEGTHHRHKLTAYAGVRMLGETRATYLRGVPAYENGDFPSGRRGRPMLKRSETWTSTI